MPCRCEVDGLCVSVHTEARAEAAGQDLSFTLTRGETLAIAGESGSGKSITALAIMGLLPPPAVRVSAGRGAAWAEPTLPACPKRGCAPSAATGSR